MGVMGGRSGRVREGEEAGLMRLGKKKQIEPLRPSILQRGEGGEVRYKAETAGASGKKHGRKPKVDFLRTKSGPWCRGGKISRRVEDTLRKNKNESAPGSRLGGEAPTRRMRATPDPRDGLVGLDSRHGEGQGSSDEGTGGRRPWGGTAKGHHFS